MFRRTILALSITALTCTGVVQAQDRATLVLRSGDRVTGQLIDLGGAGFTIKVDGVEKQVPVNDVAVIDFSGGTMGDADGGTIADGQQVLWLKNGQAVHGQIYDIGGTSPLKITFRTATGDREFSSAEIGRIVLAAPNTAVATSGSFRSATGTASAPGIAVSSRQPWTPTGMTVRQGDQLTFMTTGDIQLSADGSDLASAAGSRSRRYATGTPLPRVLAGALIGRIGSGAPFAIGSMTSMVAPDAGQLFLGINDHDLNDNQGEFRVQITNAGEGRK